MNLHKNNILQLIASASVLDQGSIQNDKATMVSHDFAICITLRDLLFSNQVQEFSLSR